LLFVIGRFGHQLSDDQSPLRFHRRLRIVALHKPLRALHDARLRVGEVVLIFLRRLRLLGCRSVFAFRRRLLPCPLLHHFLGHLDLGQPRLPPPQFLRQLVATLVAVSLVFFLVSGFGLRQQLLHLFLQLRLLLLHPSVVHRLVFDRVGLYLRAIQGHPPQFHSPCLQRHLQLLFEQTLQCRDVHLA